MGSFNKQLCLGVAAAGIVGLGSAVATGVANADTPTSDTASSQSADSSGTPSAGPRARARGQAGIAKPAASGASQPDGPTVSAAETAPRTPRRTNPKRVPDSAPVVQSAESVSVNPISIPTVTATEQPVLASVEPVEQAVAPLSTQPAVLVEPAPAVRAPVRPAPTPVRVPVVPIPIAPFPVVPASAVSASTSAATGRSRNTVVAFPASSQVYEPLDAVTDAPVQHVLVIGIDGTNLSAILADSFNTNLFSLMGTGTTAASTIVGHTTISNPSWTGILTGVWSETAGVSNNVFTPWTYDTWPTVFNQLETYNPAIQTTAIANWANIAQIAGAGSIPADVIQYYAPVNNDFIASDNTVGAASVQAIQNTLAGTPSFQFTYFVGVDDTGHEFNAGSPQYANALRNVDVNIGAILNEIDAWEAANPGEEWTVIVTTDHGQVPWPTIRIGSEERAHGFQTPWETTTFVIANGPGFEAGAINNTYKNIDVTPTVVKLFGIAPEPYSQGTPLMDLTGNTYRPIVPGIDAIKQALSDAIDMYGYPDIATNVSLVIRTIAATIPYVVFTVFDSLAQSVPEFLALPVEFIGAIIYQMVNIPAQVIVRLTGVTGNQIIPPNWWPYEPIPGTQTQAPASAAVACGSNSSAAARCLAS